MKKNCFFIIILLVLSVFLNTHPGRTDTNRKMNENDSRHDYEKFKQLLEKLTDHWTIPGLSIAIIRDGTIDFYHSIGEKKMNTSNQVDENTIFDAASLTKPLFAYLIMQFVDKGVIDPDKPIVEYLRGTTILEDYLGRFNYKVSQKGFRNDWFSLITPKHILSHSAGLPHGETHHATKPDVYPIFFKPGTDFKYSAEGYYILQKIIEHLTGQPLEKLIEKYIFNPLHMTNSYMKWTDKISHNAAFGHSGINIPNKALRKAEKSHAGGSLYTTARDYAKFLMAVLNKKALTDSTFKLMFTPVVPIEENISYAPGFTVENSSNGMCCWHTGDYSTFRNFAYANIGKKYGVIYLTNSFYGLSIYPDIIKYFFKGSHPILQCKFLRYYRHLEIFQRINKNFEDALKYFSSDTFRQSPEFKTIEAKINYMAYQFMSANQVKKALKLFQYNTSTFPHSFNAWDSQGEFYMKTGQKKKAIHYYKKSLELNPKNQNAKEMLKKLNEVHQ